LTGAWAAWLQPGGSAAAVHLWVFELGAFCGDAGTGSEVNLEVMRLLEKARYRAVSCYKWHLSSGDVEMTVFISSRQLLASAPRLQEDGLQLLSPNNQRHTQTEGGRETS
jgi:hypothetical protein